MFVYVDVISLKDSEISENKRIREIRAGRLSCLYNIDRNDLSFFFKWCCCCWEIKENRETTGSVSDPHLKLECRKVESFFFFSFFLFFLHRSKHRKRERQQLSTTRRECTKWRLFRLDLFLFIYYNKNTNRRRGFFLSFFRLVIRVVVEKNTNKGGENHGRHHKTGDKEREPLSLFLGSGGRKKQES